MIRPTVIKGMFFDLDGTLCDTDEANFEAYAKAFADEGYTITRAAFDTTNGLRADAFIPMLAPGVTEAAVANIMKNKAAYYADQMHLVKPNRRLIDFLESVRDGHTTVLVTTAKRRNAENVLRAAGIDHLFDHLIFGDEVTQAKPHPEAYLKALELSGLEPAEAIAFEDSDAGVQAASAAGLRVIKVSARL